MTPKSNTSNKLIADIEKKLDHLTTVVKYEALKEIAEIKVDLGELKLNLSQYATTEAILRIDKRVDKIGKIIERITWTVVTAVLLAIMSLIFRKTL